MADEELLFLGDLQCLLPVDLDGARIGDCAFLTVLDEGSVSSVLDVGLVFSLLEGGWIPSMLDGGSVSSIIELGDACKWRIDSSLHSSSLL